MGHSKCSENKPDYPGVGYVLISTLVVPGTVSVWDTVGENHKAVVTTGDGVSMGGTVSEVTNYVGYSFNINSSAASNDNETLTLFNAGVTFCHSNKTWTSFLA